MLKLCLGDPNAKLNAHLAVCSSARDRAVSRTSLTSSGVFQPDERGMWIRRRVASGLASVSSAR